MRDEAVNIRTNQNPSLWRTGGPMRSTLTDVAREADVAVQTVFNHFPTKEEFFSEGRVPWVEAPAAAVRDRRPGESR